MKEFERIKNSEGNAIDKLIMFFEYMKNNSMKMNKQHLFEMQKYYPKLNNLFFENVINKMPLLIVNNLHSGITDKLYRENIDPEIIQLIFSIIIKEKLKHIEKDQGIDIDEFRKTIIEYHLRGICTEKGLEYIKEKKYLTKPFSHIN